MKINQHPHIQERNLSIEGQKYSCCIHGVWGNSCERPLKSEQHFFFLNTSTTCIKLRHITQKHGGQKQMLG